MNRYLYTVVFFLITLIGFSSCKDDMIEEMTVLKAARVFKPSDIKIVAGETSAVLSWAAPLYTAGQTIKYTVVFSKNQDFSTVAYFKEVTTTSMTVAEDVLSVRTPYFVRITANGNLEQADSKPLYSAGSFTLTGIDFSLPVRDHEIYETAAVLRIKTTSSALTSIKLTPATGSVVTAAITPSDISAGFKLITGLAAGKAYTAQYLAGTADRGIRTLTTLPATTYTSTITSADNLATVIANAADGAVIGLTSGTYTINADLAITKSITLKGVDPTDKPIVRGAIFRVRSNAGLGLKDLILDGTGSLSGNQMIIYDIASDNAFANLLVENNQIKNYTKGLVYVNVKTWIQSVNFKGNVINNIECNGGDFIDFRNGIATTFNFQNNTVYASALLRDLFRMDAGGSTNFPAVASVITVSNNTLNGVCNGAGNRLYYIRLANHQITSSKNIVANSGGILTNQLSTNIIGANFISNNYFNAPTYISGSITSGAKYDAGSYTTLDPGFANAAGGDFTLTNSTLKTNGIGDPRWKY